MKAGDPGHEHVTAGEGTAGEVGCILLAFTAGLSGVLKAGDPGHEHGTAGEGGSTLLLTVDLVTR